MEEQTNTTEVAVITPDTAVAVEPAQTGGESTAVAASGEYTPNYSVKAYDVEYQIPENFRPMINKDNEQEFQKVFSKAYGLDVMKTKNEKLREQNVAFEKEIKDKYLPISRGLDIANKYLANKDYDSLFDLLKIPEKDLQQWMLRKLQMRDLPADQQEMYSKHSTTQQQVYKLEQMTEQYRQELETMKETNTQAQVQQRVNELEKVLNRPDVKAVSDRFDTRLNKAGAFKEEVIQRAQFIAQTKGQDLSAEQAVEDFVKMIVLDAGAASPANTVIPAGKAGTKNPTLPGIAGQSNSPAAQKITSIADLQKLKKAVIAQMGQN